MNFINLYCRNVLQEELRIMLRLSFYIATVDYTSPPIEPNELTERVIERITPPGPGYGWGFYYKSFNDLIRSWLY